MKKALQAIAILAALFAFVGAFSSCGTMKPASGLEGGGTVKRDGAVRGEPMEPAGPSDVDESAEDRKAESTASVGGKGGGDMAAPAPEPSGRELVPEKTPSAKKAPKSAVVEEGFVSRGSDGTPPAASRPAAARPAAPAESGLKAGYSDDNEQFNYYLNFVERYGASVEQYPLRIGERIVIRVADEEGKPLNGASVSVTANGKRVTSGKTYASGAFSLYPLEHADVRAYDVVVTRGAEKASLRVDRGGPRSIELRMKGKRALPDRTPLDILFIIDTTGSMSEEIQRLKDTIEIINANVAAVSPEPLVRFGMILYRDRDDAYVTKIVPLTESLGEFQEALDWVEADGGGDTPEDLQSALGDAVKKIQWNRDGIRLAFVITDAEAHLDYGQSYTYAEAARDAKAAAIKIHTVGTGGLPLEGEYVLRQISQYTQGRYIFLTYGEKGESSGGREASVSHHTGSNYQTDKLEAIIIRFAREELALQSDVPVQAADDYFEAKKIAGEERDDTLGKLFGQALRNLADYSTIGVGERTKAAIAPLGFPEAEKTALSAQAEYFSESLLLAASSGKVFTLVERKDLQKILEEQELQYSALADEKTAAKLGSLIGAEVMVTGQVYAKGGAYEVFLKLVRVETGEVLSVVKAKIVKELGL